MYGLNIVLMAITFCNNVSDVFHNNVWNLNSNSKLKSISLKKFFQTIETILWNNFSKLCWNLLTAITNITNITNPSTDPYYQQIFQKKLNSVVIMKSEDALDPLAAPVVERITLCKSIKLWTKSLVRNVVLIERRMTSAQSLLIAELKRSNIPFLIEERADKVTIHPVVRVRFQNPTEDSVEESESIEVAETQSGLEAADLQSDQWGGPTPVRPEVAANGVEEELITISENKSVGNTDSELNPKDGIQAELPISMTDQSIGNTDSEADSNHNINDQMNGYISASPTLAAKGSMK